MHDGSPGSLRRVHLVPIEVSLRTLLQKAASVTKLLSVAGEPSVTSLVLLMWLTSVTGAC